MSRIVVTGMGIISAIGKDLPANRLSLVGEKGGICLLEFYPSAFAGKLPCGEIKTSSAELQKTLGLAHQTGLTRTSLLALHAFNEAVSDSGLNLEETASSDTALISATTVGGMCLTNELYRDAHASGSGSPYLSSYDYGSVAISLQKQYGMRGPVNTINTACSSSANAILYGARLIKQGYVKRAIVGGVDSLAKFTINGFNALHILSPELCAPFDRDRRGLNLGEGAAFLVLEKEETATNKKVYARLSGYGNSNDAHHPSSTSDEGEGPFLSMREAVSLAGLNPSEIGYINAHGTGTENNDITESRAMQRLFGKVPAFSSGKSYTGHTLGAAGAIGAVYAILSLQWQELYPSLQYKTPIPETELVPVQRYRKASLQHVMSNSFGFGGNCTTLIFSKA